MISDRRRPSNPPKILSRDFFLLNIKYLESRIPGKECFFAFRRGETREIALTRSGKDVVAFGKNVEENVLVTFAVLAVSLRPNAPKIKRKMVHFGALRIPAKSRLTRQSVFCGVSCTPFFSRFGLQSGSRHDINMVSFADAHYFSKGGKPSQKGTRCPKNATYVQDGPSLPVWQWHASGNTAKHRI
jgi:hypothetical protein